MDIAGGGGDHGRGIINGNNDNHNHNNGGN